MPSSSPAGAAGGSGMQPVTRWRGHQRANAAFQLEKRVKSFGRSCTRRFLWVSCVLWLLPESFGETRVFLRRGSAFVPAARPGAGGMCVMFSKGQGFFLAFSEVFPIC